MKKLVALAIATLVVSSVKSQSIKFARSCWNREDKKYAFVFFESGSKDDAVEYSTGADTSKRVLLTRYPTGEYVIILDKKTGGKEPKNKVYIYINGKKYSEKEDNDEECPKSLPLKYVSGSFRLVGEPNEIVELNH